MIFLVGSIRMLHTLIIEKFQNKIFNIYPALFPKYGRKGMHGMNVHNAVIVGRETVTGVTYRE